MHKCVYKDVMLVNKVAIAAWVMTIVTPVVAMAKPEPIMLSVLPIIPSRISHHFYPLFLFYSHVITYYSCYIL